MRTKEETITVRRARDLLATNGDNRNLRLQWVEKLTQAIQRGEWLVTHQGIAIDPDGVLLDGQHRLAAVVAAQTSVRMMVTYDVDPEAFGVIDSGRARTTADAMRISGYSDVNVRAAALRTILGYHEVPPKATWSSRSAYGLATTEQLLALAEKTSLDNALANSYRITVDIGRSGLRSALTAALFLIEEHAPVTFEKIGPEFVAGMATGANQAAGSPILAWRRAMANWGATTTKTRRQVPPPITLAMTISAWNSWVTHTPRKIAHFRLGVQPMPRVAALADLDPGEDLYRMRVSADMKPVDVEERTDHPEPAPEPLPE